MKHTKKHTCNWTTGIIIFVIVVAVLYFINFKFKITDGFSKGFNKNSKTYTAQSDRADVSFTTNDAEDFMYITVKYKDLTGVSGVHIHVNNNGQSGPILAWLGTTTAWQTGVLQNTPGKNSPCCTKNNTLCVLAAPQEIPYLTNLANTQRTFKVYKSDCGGPSCPWITNGASLDFHGFNFQQVTDGVLTSAQPGLDMIESVLFSLVAKPTPKSK